MDDFRPGVTVVATVYNKAYCLPSVVSALQKQVYRGHIEYIFVDDGSSDDSVRQLEELCAPLAHVLILRQSNSGPSRALTLGLSLSRTVYTKGLDGDDVLAADAIETLLEALTQNPTARWAYGNSVAYDRDLDARIAGAAVSPASTPAAVIEDQLYRSLVRSCTNPSSWLAETALLAEAGFCDAEVFVQDYSIELRMAARSPAVFLPRTIFYKQAGRDKNRLSDDERQTLHDVCRSTGNFFSEHPQFIPSYGWEFARRNAGRAWHWARRREGRTILSNDFFRVVRSRLRLGDPIEIISQSCRAFGADIRVPGRTAEIGLVLAKGNFLTAPLQDYRGRAIANV